MHDSVPCRPARETPRALRASTRALALAVGGLVLLGATPVERPPSEGDALVERPPSEGDALVERPPSEGAAPVEPAPAEGNAPGSPADGTLRNDLDLSNDLLARALATALKSVYDRYATSAAAIPPDVRKRLEDEYGDELSRARYAVSPEAIRLLAAIDRYEGTSFGEGMHALTIDGLILLATDPAENESPFALWIWAHELHHVRQYRERGSILAFARDYIRDCDAIERAADERANRALDMDVSVSHCLQ